MGISNVIDSTNLKSEAGEGDIKAICLEAREYGVRGVCVNSRWVKTAKELLKNTGIKVVSVIDFPLGASLSKVRLFQAKQAKEDGADELDIVMNIGALKSGLDADILKDLGRVSEILSTKVIIETGLLSDQEIQRAAQLVKKSRAFCVKTSTGFVANTDIETKARHIKLIKEAVPDIKIKASGGIKTRQDAETLIACGADIIGTSSAVQIIKS